MVKAVTPIPFVKARFFDRCGKPLAGGKVHTYAANTTTEKTTYKDPYGLTPNTNPIVLDAAGEADIYLEGTYRIRITDRNNVLVNDVEKIGSWFSDDLQDTLNNISGAMSETIEPIVNSLAAIEAGKNGWTDLLIQTSKGRTQSDKNLERVSVKDFGARGDDNTDDYAAIMAASKTGNPLFFPKGIYLVSKGMVFDSKQNWLSDGDVIIKYNAQAKTAIEPVLDFKDTVVTTGKFIVNHNANVGNYKDPEVYDGDIIAGSAVLIQGNNSILENFEVVNAWDNGISIIKLGSDNKPVPGMPKYWNLGQIKTKNCGCGFHLGGMIPNSKVGGGIDIASGSMGVVNSHIDEQSYTGFILDIGAGGQVTVGSIVSIYPRCGEEQNSTGIGVFIGSGDSCFNQITVIGSEGYPVWYDGTAQNCNANIYAYNCQREILIKGGSASFNIRTKNTGLQSKNTVPAVLIDTTAGNLSELVIDLLTTGEYHKYAIDVLGANNVDAIIKGSMTGVTAIFNNFAGKNIFTENHIHGSYAVNRDYARGIFDLVGDFFIRDKTPNKSYLESAFGDSGNNGTYFIEDATTAKRAAMGYDNNNDVFVIQAIEPNIMQKTIALNPSGGSVLVGKGDFINPVMLGSYSLWVDTTGNLRIKSGKPSTDTDGTKVGSQ